MPDPDAAPLVSVCIVVHDGLRWLPGAVASVLAQDHADLELLLLDAGSSDGSAAAIDAAAERDPRVRALPPGPNVGYAAGQDRLIGAARGPARRGTVAADPRTPPAGHAIREVSAAGTSG